MRLPSMLLVVVSVAWALTACRAAGVADMARILVNPPEVVDVTAISARVAALTNVDIVCSVAYGTTMEYGCLATDTDVAVAGHRDPGTQWFSDGDGDDAWIEIELAGETEVTALGFWTRTMGTSAQVRSFQVVLEDGDIMGPFVLDDAATIHYFQTEFRARWLRFEVVESSGGNTGGVEIEVYGDPVC